MTSMIFSVEGNIGSGKSTLIKHLKEKLKTISGIKIVYLEEPVDIWQTIKNKQGDNMKMFTKIAAVVALSSFMFAGMSITWGNNYSENTTGDLT